MLHGRKLRLARAVSTIKMQVCGKMANHLPPSAAGKTAAKDRLKAMALHLKE
jgi:hypothetical protein